MGKISGIEALIRELLSLPIAEAAIRMSEKKLDTLITWATLDKRFGQIDVKKLELIKKRRQQPALGKDTPKGTDKITKLTPIPRGLGHGEFSYKGKTGSAAIKAFRKNPMSRDKFLDQIREQAIEKLDALENLSHAARESGIEQIEGLADKYWKNLYKAANPSTVPSKAFKQKPSKPKKPTMQKGGAYKGKKHSYSAGGKVNKLNF